MARVIIPLYMPQFGVDTWQGGVQGNDVTQCLDGLEGHLAFAEENQKGTKHEVFGRKEVYNCIRALEVVEGLYVKLDN